ncbi:MAG: type II toxin-antitoxin system VapC family toxin [Planctomycetes bacterium]|nr:type II toxin-antitoxin system VapC family toxin [Planctomycetota bacterium]
MSVTIDASVFVSAARSPEPHHADSLKFVECVVSQAEDVFCPTLVLVESSAAVARQTDSPVLAAKTLAFIEDLPSSRFLPLDLAFARKASQLAMTYRLRGADAVYAMVAQAVGATLVTWDAELLQRGRAVVPVLTPTEWLAKHGKGG